MNLRYPKDVSFSVAAFFLKSAGFWTSVTRVEKWRRNATIFYTVLTSVFGICVQIRDIYFSWGDINLCTHLAGNIIVAIIDFIKLFMILIYKKQFLGLIVYMQKNFWHSKYDQDENSIIADARHTCFYFVCIFSFFCQFTVIIFIVRPIITNIGRNGTDKLFIFNMWLPDLPLTTSPYFEITFIIHALILYQIGVCYLCFDNMFCIMCLHVSSQFRILQYRLSNAPSLKDKKNSNEELTDSSEYYAMLKNCIERHQALIQFCDTLDEIFNIVLLGQVLIFSVLICFLGYQLLMVDLSFSYRINLMCFLLTNISQLWVFTYSSDCVTQESENVAWAVYAGPWTNLRMDKFGRMTRNDLLLVSIRSQRPCCLTAGGFFPISLQTYTKIMSTSVSYFTLLKQRTVDAVN